MISNNPLALKRVSAAAVTLFVAATCFLGVANTKAAPSKTSQTKKKAKNLSAAGAQPATHHSSTATRAGSSRTRGKHTARQSKGSKRGLPSGSRQRLARLHLDPQRVREIQQALIREGALNGSPTGQWDDATRDAMRQYQSNNGFSRTGLPDARSLMKLGLGPHPLPESLQASASAQSGAESVAGPNPN